MKSQHIDIKIENKNCDAFVVYPNEEGRFPAVLLLMDAFGPRPYLEKMASTLAEQGYFVLLPNMFYRVKRAPILDAKFPLRMEDMPEARKAMMAIYGDFSADLAINDIAAFLKFLESQKQVRPGKIGVTGYCMGGGLALRAAGTFPESIAAAASFHGGKLATEAENSPHRFLNRVKGEVYIAHADHDGSIPPEQQELLQKALDQSQIVSEVELYKGATHGFTMADLPSYNEEALARHWKKLTALFQRTLKP